MLAWIMNLGFAGSPGVSEANISGRFTLVFGPEDRELEFSREDRKVDMPSESRELEF